MACNVMEWTQRTRNRMHSNETSVLTKGREFLDRVRDCGLPSHSLLHGTYYGPGMLLSILCAVNLKWIQVIIRPVGKKRTRRSVHSRIIKSIRDPDDVMDHKQAKWIRQDDQLQKTHIQTLSTHFITLIYT
jgi:hypothetical protein